MLIIKSGFEICEIRSHYKHGKKEKRTERKSIVNILSNIILKKATRRKIIIYIERKKHI